ncbi:MAG TPA: hypothetical protein VEZ11_07085 [Thermoanaerobaculia bacterium]|nr:hypothetical protein [Thermoanaerobaculia bacterium]
MTTSAVRSYRSSAGTLGFALFLAIAVVPIAASLLYALLYTLGLTGLLSNGFTLTTWSRVVTSRETWAAFGISAYVSAVVCALSTFGGLGVALFLRSAGVPPAIAARPRAATVLGRIVRARGRKGHSVEIVPPGEDARRLQAGRLHSRAIAFLYLPLALPMTVGAFAGYQILSPIGLFARIAARIHLIGGAQEFPAFTNDVLHLGVIAVHVLLALPFFALLFLQLCESERVDAYAALSRSLGATDRQTLLRVTLPILLHRTRVNVLLLFVIVLGSYEIPLLLGRQYPMMVSVLTVTKYQRFDLLQKPEAFAIAILYTIVSGAAIVIALRQRQEETA